MAARMLKNTPAIAKIQIAAIAAISLIVSMLSSPASAIPAHTE